MPTPGSTRSTRHTSIERWPARSRLARFSSCSHWRPDCKTASAPRGIFTCTGSYQVPGEAKPRLDDVPQGHGQLTAPGALAPSCDVVFWQIAALLNSKDPDLLPQMAKAFGFGAYTDIVGVPKSDENPGIVPDPDWMKANNHGTWSPTDAANLGIGQGFFQATPAQIALATAAIADNGIRMQPRLVRRSWPAAARRSSLSRRPDGQRCQSAPIIWRPSRLPCLAHSMIPRHRVWEFQEPACAGRR